MNEIQTVLSTVGFKAEQLQRLRDVFAEARFIQLRPNDAAGIAEALRLADVAILASDLDERYWNAPRLRWIHCDHAGLNNSARPEVFERGLLVSGSAGRSAPALADHALFFMLALTFQYPSFLDAQRAHLWGFPGQEKLRGLYGQTVGIIGMGNIGRELALRAKACGMRVHGYRRRAADCPEAVDRMYCAERGEQLDSLLRECDFAIVAVPLSDATHHLIGARELALMKPTAFLINLARGAIVDEAALLCALREARLAGAGLDTFSQEPLPPSHPLWDAPRTLITPHCTPPVYDRTERSIAIIAENARRYRAGERLLNELTPADVYTRG
ncbi:D-2-hydroxyacid dehydrogenase [Paenibacillus sp. IB182496]|uniref:D-2-hydroxyacid dehydrogenase n=1 Tax=Paenibacillus sabuli TaxID=2772509 RepID=A0A927BPZ4_9BACL|nr:D-2-hydroxyacid dehydrogenase [Paenibacillus sabuli]MBD2844132.1 D-2-hydroxyacid dehydrogenase [Paenibacillus sabuli]